MNQEVNNVNPVTPVNAVNNANDVASIPESYKPISMWGYFGYEILFSIPCIGFILLLVFAFGGTQNINLRNFARSYFCYMIILVILILLITMIIAGLGIGSAAAEM